MVDHNVAIILTNLKQTAAAKVMFHKTLNFFIKDKEISNEKAGMIEKCKDNYLIASLSSPNSNYEPSY